MRLAVLIAAHNAARHIEDALRSVIVQSGEYVAEVIVVDDGSTDDTAERVRRVGAGDPRVRVLQIEHGGISVARNACLAAVGPETDWITFLDADDQFAPERLRIEAELLNRHEDAEVIVGRMLEVRSEAGDLASELVPDAQGIRPSSLHWALIRADIAHETGLFDLNYAQGEDLDFSFRTYERSPNVLFHDKVVLLYRRHDANVTNDGAAKRRALMRAMYGHMQRRKADPALAPIDRFLHEDKP